MVTGVPAPLVLFVVYDRLESSQAKQYQWRVHTPGNIEPVDTGLYRVSNGDVDYYLRDLLLVDSEPEIDTSNIVVTYRFRGDYTRHICFTAKADRPVTNFAFCLGPTVAAVRHLSIDRQADALHLDLPGYGRFAVTTQV